MQILLLPEQKKVRCNFESIDDCKKQQQQQNKKQKQKNPAYTKTVERLEFDVTSYLEDGPK